MGPQDLSGASFDKLLARLDPDREQAGEKYRNLHRKLVKLFEWRRCSDAETLADQTLDRVIAKLDEVRINDVTLYVLGVANLVLKETWRASIRETPLDALLPARVPRADPRAEESWKMERRESDRRLDCLEKCMSKLSTVHCALLEEYYQGKKSQKIEARQAIAARLGVSLATLRVQAHRIRSKLAECVEDCLAVGGGRS